MTIRQHSHTAAARTAPKISGQIHPGKVREAPPESGRQHLHPPQFAESLLDQVDPDLRHRMISEAAYRLYEERGFADGYDFDDWLQAESAVERQLLEERPNEGPTSQA